MTTTPAIAEHNGTRARLRTLDGSTLAVPVLCWSSTGTALVLDGSTGRLAQAQDLPGFDGLELHPDVVEIRDALDLDEQPQQLKTCRRCHQEKPQDDFNRKTSAADGRQSYCRPCDQPASRTR